MNIRRHHRPTTVGIGLVAVSLAGLLIPAPASAASANLVERQSTWHVLDNGTDQTPAFAGTSFVEGDAWHAETIQPGKVLGYGDNTRTTLPTQTPNLSFGPSSTSKYITTYFRQTFTVLDASQVTSLVLNLIRDDGAVVYLNGVEVARSNMPAGAITSATFSAAIVDGAAEYAVNAITIPTSSLVSGQNLLAIELHQRDGTSSDLGLSAELVATTSDPVVPEAPLTALLSLGAVAVLGGAVVVSRRRAVV